MANLFKNILAMFALMVFFVAFVQSQPKQCPRNQEWTSCGTACPKKCGQPAPSFCTYQCIVGCQCKSGYLLKSNGNCVAARDC